jgi:hypothetical protein
MNILKALIKFFFQILKMFLEILFKIMNTEEYFMEKLRKHKLINKLILIMIINHYLLMILLINRKLIFNLIINNTKLKIS